MKRMSRECKKNVKFFGDKMKSSEFDVIVMSSVERERVRFSRMVCVCRIIIKRNGSDLFEWLSMSHWTVHDVTEVIHKVSFLSTFSRPLFAPKSTNFNSTIYFKWERKMRKIKLKKKVNFMLLNNYWNKNPSPIEIKSTNWSLSLFLLSICFGRFDFSVIELIFFLLCLFLVSLLDAD